MRGPEILRTHLYTPAPGDWPTKPPCTCDMPWNARIHDVPETPPEAAVIDARRLGETQEQHQEEDGDPS